MFFINQKKMFQNLYNKKEYAKAGKLINKLPVDFLNNFKRKELHFIAERGRSQLLNKGSLDFLMSIGADINMKDESGFTIIDKVCSRMDFGLASLLVHNGANIENVKNINQFLDYAIANKEIDIVSKLLPGIIVLPEYLFHMVMDSQDIFDIFLRFSAETDYRLFPKNYIPLILTANYGKVDMLNLLIQKGADVNTQDSNGWTALMHAAYTHFTPHKPDSSDKCKLLLSCNAGVNIQSNDGWTALHSAVRSGNIEIVNALITKGANINAVCKKNGTPLNEAVSNENSAIAQLLLDQGAKYNSSFLDALVHYKRINIIKYLLDHDLPREDSEYLLNKTREKLSGIHYLDDDYSQKEVDLLQEIIRLFEYYTNLGVGEK